jgi:hypothetical protein
MQALPLFSWMQHRDAQDLLHRSCLQLLEDGTLLAAAGEAPSDSSLVHLLIAGEAASALALGPCPVSVPETSCARNEGEAGSAGRQHVSSSAMRCSWIRELCPGAAVGLSSMALQRPSQASVFCMGTCLVLTTEAGSVRDVCVKHQRQEQLTLLSKASEEAARQEEVLASLARASLQTLSELRPILQALLAPLDLLVGTHSFHAALSRGGEGAVPARNLAVLFSTAPKLREITSQLLGLLTALFQGDGKQGLDAAADDVQKQEQAPAHEPVQLEFKLETLSQALVMLGSLAYEGMAPLASSALRAVAELTWLRAEAAIAARIADHEQLCGKALVDVMCEPLCVWTRVARVAEALVREAAGSLRSLGSAANRHVACLRQVISLSPSRPLALSLPPTHPPPPLLSLSLSRVRTRSPPHSSLTHPLMHSLSRNLSLRLTLLSHLHYYMAAGARARGRRGRLARALSHGDGAAVCRRFARRRRLP